MPDVLMYPEKKIKESACETALIEFAPIPIIYSLYIKRGNGVIQMSKKQIFEAVLLALTIMLTVAKTIDEIGKLPELNDKTDQEF